MRTVQATPAKPFLRRVRWRNVGLVLAILGLGAALLRPLPEPPTAEERGPRAIEQPPQQERGGARRETAQVVRPRARRKRLSRAREEGRSAPTRPARRSGDGGPPEPEPVVPSPTVAEQPVAEQPVLDAPPASGEFTPDPGPP